MTRSSLGSAGSGPLLLALALLALVMAAWASPAPPTELTPGTPFQGALDQSTYAYFKTVVPSGSVAALTTTVTPMGNGDPDLYCSLVAEFPDRNNYQKRAIGWGEDSISWSQEELPTELPAPVFCSVHAWVATNFTIVSSFETTLVELTDGVPQSAHVNLDVQNFYQFQTQSGAGDVSISATALRGELAFFVSNNGQTPNPAEPASYQWRSQHQHTGEVLVIFASDAKWPATGQFVITVLGKEDDTAYSLVASTNETNTLLRDGLPQQHVVQTDSLSFFKTLVHGTGCSLTVTVTPITGDPDLYMARNIVHPRPGHFEKRSWGLGGDTIVYEAAEAGTYYIGVHAYADQSQFSILAHTSGCDGPPANDTEWLLPGVPQHGSVGRLGRHYYMMNVRGNDTEVSFSLTRNFGDPDLYVTTDGSRPTTTNYQFRSVSWGEDLLMISPEMPGYCTDCDYWVMVWGASDTSYSITGSTSKAIVTLREGVATRKRVPADEYLYFRFPMSAWGKTLTFAVTDLGRGDPDVFVSTTTARPSEENHMWSSMLNSSDSVTIPPSDTNYCGLCTYYVSVRGTGVPSTFTILASYDDLVRLTDSVPQSAAVAKAAVRYFYLEMNADFADVTFSTSNARGITNMFISSCPNPSADASNCILPEPANPGTWSWAAYGSRGARSLRITPVDEEACTNTGCLYVVGVEGVTDSDFTLIGRTAGSTLPLQNGVGVPGHINSGQWLYFSYRVDTPGRDLSVVVTPLSGDPDLYISLSNPRPNTTHYDRASVRFGEDIIDFPDAEVSHYYIGVIAYTNCSFTVMALEASHDGDDQDSVIQLADGLPVSSNVHFQHYRYFSFEVSEDVADVTFTVTPRFGDPDVYIHNDGNFPTRDHHRWSSRSSGADLVRITSPEAGQYLVGVYGYSTASFMITATTGITQLQNSVPVRGQLETSEYRYYRFVVDDDSKDLVITVTPFSGDPDLYMSRERVLTPGTLPNMTNYEWAAQSFLGDSITVPHTDPRLETGAYIIGVYSYIACSFTIVATLSDRQVLVDGLPQSGTVARHAWKYYSLQVFSHRKLTLSVTPLNGNPNLYVTSGPVDDTELPTLERWDRKADGWYTGGQIVYDQGDSDFCAGEDCIYWIGVYGAEAANFSLIATTNRNSIALRDGLPVREHANTGEFSYFVYEMREPGNDLIVTVTPLTGDPDIYASDEHRHPNKTHFKWVSRGTGSDALSVPEAAPGHYYIGIYGHENTTFTVTAMAWNREDTGRKHLLVDGQPQRGAVPQAAFTYYVMHLYTDFGTGQRTGFEDVTFSVSTMVGDPDIYITNDGSLPSLDNWRWRSSTWGEDSVHIAKPDDGSYIVGVYGFTASTFTILGATTLSSRVLLAGVPFSETMSAGKFEYFQFSVDSSDYDLTVTVTAIQGDPDLFMSAIHDRPNATHSEWRGQGYLEDSITIPSDQLKMQTYWISVYAYTNTSYTIVANFGPTVNLQNGIPQSGSLPAREAMAYFQFQVPADYPDLSVYLSPLSGSFYLLMSAKQKPEYGKPDSYEWSSTDSTGQQQIVLRRGDKGFCNDCTRFFIAVYSTSRGASMFNVVASTSVNGLVTLIDGISQRRSLRTNEWEYYRFNLLNDKVAMVFSVTPISGDPDMFISTETHRPDQDNHQWAGAGWGADVVAIDYTHENFTVGEYYVGVYAFEATTYTIGVQVIDLSHTNVTTDTLLFNGQPQVGFLEAAGKERYFRFMLTQSGEERPELTITAIPRYGDPDLLVYVGEDRHATHENAQWGSRNYGRDSVTIRPNDEAYCLDCFYKITVTGYTHTLFTITASSGTAIRMLEMGVPFRDEVDTGEFRYFQLVVSRPTDPLVIAATVLTSDHQLGDPDMFIAHESSGNHYPNATHHDWAETHFGSDVFSLARPEPGFYYVSIRGYRATTFSITGYNGPITLIPGEPQKGVVTQEASALFIMSLTEFKTRQGNLEFTAVLDSIGSAALDMWACANCPNPGPDNHHWSNQNNTQTGIRNQIVIAPSDPKACDNCLIFVRVASIGRSSFTMNAGYSTDVRTLVSGQPVLIASDGQQYRHFRAVVDTRQQDVMVDATLYVGEIVVIASFEIMQPDLDSDPTKVWRSDRISSGAVHMLLEHDDPRFRTGALLFISVFAAIQSRYTLSMTSGHLQLADGMPQLAVIPATQPDQPNHGAQFFFRNYVATGRRPTDLALSLTPRAADELDVVEFGSDSRYTARAQVLTAGAVAPKKFTVYVSTSEQEDPNPGPDNYKWKKELGELESLLLPTTDAAFCAQCMYFISVRGQEGAQFSIKVSTADSYVLLLDGVKDHSAVRENQYRYFEMFVASATNFSTFVEPCSGSVSVYASQNDYRPTKNRYKWKSDAANAIQEISNADGSISDATFFIGVFGRRTSEFVIHGHTRPLPSINPVPGDLGAISTTTRDAKTVELSWTPAKTASGQVKPLRYHVYKKKLAGHSPEQEGVVMYTQCGLQRADTAGSQLSDSTQVMTYKVGNLQAHTYYTFNVMVEDPETGGFAIYDDTPGVKTLSQDDLGVDVGVIFAVALPILAVVVLVIAFLCYRNRKLSRAAMDIQMNDVPDHAVRKAVRDPTQAASQAKKYHQLLADEDSFAADLAYSPPAVGADSSLNSADHVKL